MHDRLLPSDLLAAPIYAVAPDGIGCHMSATGVIRSSDYRIPFSDFAALDEAGAISEIQGDGLGCPDSTAIPSLIFGRGHQTTEGVKLACTILTRALSARSEPMRIS